MKKAFILGTVLAITGLGAAHAQVSTDTPPPPVNVTPPPPTADPIPPPPPPIEQNTAPAPAQQTTTTTTTAVTQTTAPAPLYDVDNRAQTRLNRLRFGAYLAPNLSWMRPTAATDDKNEYNVERDGSRAGFTYGLMAEYFFAENYGIVTGLQINQTGGSVIVTNRDQSPATPNSVKTADFDYRLQYLEIPIALKLRTDDINGFRFFGQLGASLGINISKKVDYEVRYTRDVVGTYDTSGEKIKLTGTTTIAPIMFQMNIGAGLEYPISNKLSFYAALFFNNGFAPDATNPEKYKNELLGYQGSFRDGNVRLNNFALRLGLFF